MGILQQIGHTYGYVTKGVRIILVLREPHMTHNVTQLEGKNDPMNFAHSVWEIVF